MQLAQQMTSKGHYAHFRNWSQRIHHPLDPPDGPFPRVRFVNLLHGFIGQKKSTSRRHLFPTLRHSITSYDGMVMQQRWKMFGSGELNASRYRSFFGGRIVSFGWYPWGAFVQVQRCNVDRYEQCDRLGRMRGFYSAIPEDTRDTCTRDVQLIEGKEILNKTNLFERLGVSAPHRSL